MRPRTSVPHLLGIAALLATIALSGCANTWGGNCMPAPLSLTPSTATAGATVTLSADGVKCEAGSGRHYQVSINHLDVKRPVGEVTPASNGSFQFAFAIPGDLPAGTYVLSVSGSTLDDCPDAHASCAGYWTDLTIEDAATG